MDGSVAASANVFFIVSSIAGVVFIAGASVLLFYLVPLARDARDLMQKFDAAAGEVEKDFKKLKKAVKS